jgi:uncharacterized small protein (DUF1192 family)
MNRRFQFSLRALLVVMLAAPPIAYWLIRSRQASSAVRDYSVATAFYDVGTASFQQVYDCSRRLRDAQLALPFADRPAALVAYLNRLARLERREDSLLHFAALGGSIDELKVRIAALAAERQALEAELGVKANADLGDASN